MAVKTRAELIAQNTATFGNGKNTRGDDEKAFNLNHLDSFLNKKGDILETNGYVAVQDGSKLKQGTNGGIALECVVGYDFQWKEGVAYYRPTGGNIVIAMSAVDQVPNTGFDSSLFYAVGSRFTNLVTNVEYICTDASVGAATWSVVSSGGGVTSVSVATDNGLAGTSSGGATPIITLSTTVTGLLKGNGTTISGATSGTDYAPATSGTSILKGNGSGGFSNATAGTDYLTSVGLTMPSAFSVALPNPLTSNGTLVVTGAGTVSQYIRGDGTLANFPTGGGGGGGTVYYLNGNTSQGSIGGTTMYQLSTAAGTGAAANFTRSTTGAIASFITDVGQPNQTTIPAGIWIFEAYLSESGGGSNHAEINAVLEKWNGSSITVISTGAIEQITNGSTKDLYQFAVTVPSGTTISASDRIVVQINISNANGKTVTLYTENSNVSSVTTTFANGISSLNGLTASTQFFGSVGTTGTAPAWTSTTATHTLNIPLASASSVTAGLISKTDYDSFAGKQSALSGTGYSKWSGSTPSYLTPTQVTADLNLFSSSLQGLVPASGGGTTNFLRADGTWAAPGGGGSGTVNSGTQYQLAYYANTGTAVSGLTTGTSGQVLALSAGLVPTWTTLSTSTTLTNIGAATATASLTNANSVITWNWNSNTTTNSFVLGSTGLISGSLFTLTHTTSALTGNLASYTSTGVTTGGLLNLGISGATATSAKNLIITNSATTNTSGRGIDIAISGATASGITYGAYISNTKTATSTNTALYLTSSGGTTNYALDVAAGISRFAAGTASTPQLILTPSTAAGGTTFTGTVNGSLWFDTNSTGTANSSLTLYKDSAYTKILTASRNPDFAIGSASGVIVADSNGTLTKSGDLTALGIFAQTSDVTTTATGAATIFGTIGAGSLTLPASFFAVGKTIRIVAEGKITTPVAPGTVAFVFSIGSTVLTVTSPTLSVSLTDKFYKLTLIATCRSIGATGTVFVSGELQIDMPLGSVYVAPVTGTNTINTTGTLALNVTSNFSAASHSITTSLAFGEYLN